MLDRILRPEHSQAGLWLSGGWHSQGGELIQTRALDFSACDLVLLNLSVGGKTKIIKTFPSQTVTIAEILHAADQWLNWQKSGVSFEKVRHG